MKANSNFELLSESYLFAEVGRRVTAYKKEHPEADIIRMDIGDVTLPIIKPVADAMKGAVEEMLSPSSFKGYGPEQGYEFLRNAISLHDYKERGLDIEPDEIFISDGAKSDIGNFTDLFADNCVIGIPTPVYPVYVDSNVICGRTEQNGKIIFIECNPEDNFKPRVPEMFIDVIYLCSPNNPTGGVIEREDLKKWVDYARKHDSLIIFDSAYESFVRSKDIPRSIYEIEGSKEVAVEIRSFSKTAGFTGLRCGYTVVPKEIKAKFIDGNVVELRKLWLRRQTTKFNGASYIIQKGAEAIFTPEGREEIKRNINYYLRNASLLRDAFIKEGYETTGGDNSPYVWIKGKKGISSWQFFDNLLSDFNISSTPGVGFGKAGEGYIRLTGFNTYENTVRAIERIESK